MEDKKKTNLALLDEPFYEDEYEHRLSQCGTTKEGKIWAQSLTYVQARAIMRRFDEVCGKECWQVSYREVVVGQGLKGFIGKISVKINGEWISKEDGSDISDIEEFKGGISGALKRAAVPWGVGALLYGLDSDFATIVDRGTKNSRQGKTKDGTVFYWLPPKLPKWAVKQVKEEKPKDPSPAAEPEKTAFDEQPTTIATKMSEPGEYIIKVGTPGGPIRDKRVADIKEADKVAASLANMIEAFKKNKKTVDPGFSEALEMIEKHFKLR